ncbi:type II toxin-antitoxin system mRNA interferase toxin, RelE/StbE family [Candidatus Falkowbacteria bacterium CG10_big_fil_rev_8_21_14_0_10_44_15]|uniref:Type II toxin-antitoxin system mRNA interferase toxin, RelE/StbE family n=1 Tax=Candidatus Falkowbacteria bacterium CG10_big_fil_rev_8_21_14_0_10_44_15 TaxID=1974569 RepID=A0A2H0V107_9BACT|nr:MAG: type II toxin-antitoxin system mRNA interferase toxin, RelE/StbE family [Candidatus Falkowbacteria bacterium CG10_big_fil_rev_8_21_14_0_10_44_15]
MIVKDIEYSKSFCKDLKKLPIEIKERAIKIERIFKANPLHPSLRLHKLHGKLKDFWYISVAMDYRIIFVRTDNGVIIFFSIGKHDIYEK